MAQKITTEQFISEKMVEQYLLDHDIRYVVKFPVRIGDHVLRFDFYIMDYDLMIEYHRLQHYQPVEFFGGQEAYDLRVFRDQLKERWCKQNDLRYFVISYNQSIHILEEVF